MKGPTLDKSNLGKCQRFFLRFPEFHLEDNVVIMEGALSRLETKKMGTNTEKEGYNSN
jgi:hypothetical protein